jgi:mannose-6-phosphate isomerase-like protein (cupin superfamily)
MNAFSHEHFHAPAQPAAMARDLLGGVPATRPPFALHKALSAMDGRGPLSLADASWPAGASVAAHAHPGEDELVVVLSGEIEITLGDRTLRRGPGSSIFIPRGTEHALRAVTEARTMAILTRQSLETPAA